MLAALAPTGALRRVPATPPRNATLTAMSEASAALRLVIDHIETLEGDVQPLLAEVVNSGDEQLVPTVLEALRSFLAERNFYGRDLMAEILVGLRGVEAFADVLAAWAVDIGDDRDSLSGLVWQLIDQDRSAALTTIRAFARSADPARKKAGIWALGHAAGPDGMDEADFEVLAVAAREPDPDIRATALGALDADKGTDRAVALWARALHDPVAQVRVCAVAGLGYSKRSDTIPAIVELADDHESRVRMFVAVALGSLEHDDGLPALAQLITDEDTLVREEAVQALSRIGGTRAGDMLLELIDHTDPDLRATAAGALARVATVATLPSLRRLCEDPEPAVRAATVAGLGVSRLRGAGSVVADRAVDPEPEVRMRVAVAIDRLHAAEADHTLVRLLDDADPAVRRTAARVIELRASRNDEPASA
jgi:HEAT repeat protein